MGSEGSRSAARRYTDLEAFLARLRETAEALDSALREARALNRPDDVSDRDAA
jgi:hypothetical protein